MAAKNTQPRDFQVSKVYRAEKMAEYLLIGDFWTRTLDEAETLALIDSVVAHPSVLARWGAKKVRVTFSEHKGRKNAWAERESGHINIPSGTCNPLWIIHELAHLLAEKQSINEVAPHGPGFASIERYLFTHIISEEAGRALDAAFAALGVKTDDTALPPVRYRPTTASRYDIPGIVTGQASTAAATLRAARDSGLFDDDPDLSKAVSRIARRLDTVERHVPATRRASAPIPNSVVIQTGAILRAKKRDDVAEIVLAAIRNQVNPTTVRPAPVDPRFTPKAKAKVTAKDAKRVLKRRID